MTRSAFVLVLLIPLSRLCAQAPPPLTPSELVALRKVKAWDIEYTYHGTETRSSSGSLSPSQGYSFGGKIIDGWSLAFLYNFDFTLSGTIAGKSGQSDCDPNSDSCIIKYAYPASIGNIMENQDRYEQAHFPECCSDGMGGWLPGFQDVRITFDISGSKTLDGTGQNWIRGSLEIDYSVNPPVASAWFNSPGLGGTATIAYSGWYSSDTNTTIAGTNHYVDIWPYDSVMTRVSIEHGRFVIRGAYPYSNDYVPCPGAWLVCDSNTQVGTANLTRIGEWVITARPDSSILVTRPIAGDLLVSGETDTIRWFTDAVDSLRIFYSTDSGQTYTLIAEGIPAAARRYAWAVPEALSRKCLIRIEAMGDTANNGTGGPFRMKGYVLTRVTPSGDYEAFTPAKHGWSVPNSSAYLWPSSWWSQFDYQTGDDPYTREMYPSSLFSRRTPEIFADWPLWVRTFGVDECYTSSYPFGDSTKYRYSAVLQWWWSSGPHQGSCEGLSVSAVAAFVDRAALAGALPAFGSSGDPADIVMTDAVRQAVNQLQITQYSQAVHENERLAYNITPNEAWIDTLKSFFLSDDPSRAAALGLYSTRGGHALAPYKITRDSGAIPGEPYYLIWVYDPNHPGDTTVAVLLRTSDGFWRTPVEGIADFISYGSGLKLNPYPMYLSNVNLPPPAGGPVTVTAGGPGATVVTGPAGRPGAPGVTGSTHPLEASPGAGSVNGSGGDARPFSPHAPRLEVMVSPGGFVTIVGQGGDSIGYADSAVFGTIAGADPVMVKTGYPAPPVGYVLPEAGGPYHALLHNFSDTSARFAIMSDSIILAYSRGDAGPGQSDGVSFDKNLFTCTNGDSAAKRLEILSVLVNPVDDRAVRISGYSLSGGGAMELKVDGGGNTGLRNDGAATTYILEEFLTREGEQMRAFRSAPITVNAGASHTVLTDWTDLASDVTIQVDEGSDGSVDDSLQVPPVITAVDHQEIGVPNRFSLHPNSPNPFNPETRIAYDVPVSVRVVLTVHDVLGREVARLVDGMKGPGRYEVIFDAGALPGGVYFYALRAGEYSAVEKMVLMK